MVSGHIVNIYIFGLCTIEHTSSIGFGQKHIKVTNFLTYTWQCFRCIAKKYFEAAYCQTIKSKSSDLKPFGWTLLYLKLKLMFRTKGCIAKKSKSMCSSSSLNLSLLSRFLAATSILAETLQPSGAIAWDHYYHNSSS